MGERILIFHGYLLILKNKQAAQNKHLNKKKQYLKKHIHRLITDFVCIFVCIIIENLRKKKLTVERGTQKGKVIVKKNKTR